MLEIVGHAIVSADGRISDAAGHMPAALRSDADWRRFQAALDRAALVVVGRLGHEAHPNPGRRRLVVSAGVAGLGADPLDPLAVRWNPAGATFETALARLGIKGGTVAVTGGTRVFDLFLPRFTRFDLVTVGGLTMPDGRPCFSGGAPGEVLAAAGMVPEQAEELEDGVSLVVWER